MAEIVKIEKLNGKNYTSWKYNAKLVLMERGLWGIANGTETGPVIKEEDKGSNSQRLMIYDRYHEGYFHEMSRNV